jgi:hypothetical protein
VASGSGAIAASSTGGRRFVGGAFLASLAAPAASAPAATAAAAPAFLALFSGYGRFLGGLVFSAVLGLGSIRCLGVVLRFAFLTASAPAATAATATTATFTILAVLALRAGFVVRVLFFLVHVLDGKIGVLIVRHWRVIDLHGGAQPLAAHFHQAEAG